MQLNKEYSYKSENLIKLLDACKARGDYILYTITVN